MPSARRAFPPLFWLVFGASLLASLRAAQVDPRLLLAPEARANVLRFVRGMFPPELSPAFLALMVNPFLETIQISVVGTVLAVLVGLPLGILGVAPLTWSGVLQERAGLRTRGLGLACYLGARALLSVFRSIPELVWALVFVRTVGLGPPAGVLAIGVAYGGVLGKVYSEILEGVSPRPLEALQAAGAGRVALLAYGWLPEAVPAFVSYTLYRWECAIRASAVLGLVGAGGLGQQIELSMRAFNFHEVLTLIGLLWALVTGVDAVSTAVRRRLGVA